jgi:hypothetical protein
LKRAKSTVGAPLINCTVLLLESVAETLSTCTANEVTAAIGASVPTTNDEPVTVCGLVVAVGVDPLQPAISSAAAVSESTAIGKRLPCVLKSIQDASHSQRVFLKVHCQREIEHQVGNLGKRPGSNTYLATLNKGNTAFGGKLRTFAEKISAKFP